MVNRSISPGIRAAVLDRDGHRCSYCGSTYDLTIDHIIPVAKGGTSNIENLRTLCSYCNTSKGSGDRPITISSERDHVRHISSVFSRMNGDWLIMTRDELTKALEEYPEKLRKALLRQYQTSMKLEEARADVRVLRDIQDDDDFDFDTERAKIFHKIRTNPSEYGLPLKPSRTEVENALLVSDEYAQLKSKQKESQGRNPYTRDESILRAREEKHLADIDVEVLRRTLEAYRILADIMK